MEGPLDLVRWGGREFSVGIPHETRPFAPAARGNATDQTGAMHAALILTNSDVATGRCSLFARLRGPELVRLPCQPEGAQSWQRFSVFSMTTPSTAIRQNMPATTSQRSITIP